MLRITTLRDSAEGGIGRDKLYVNPMIIPPPKIFPAGQLLKSLDAFGAARLEGGGGYRNQPSKKIWGREGHRKRLTDSGILKQKKTIPPW